MIEQLCSAALPGLAARSVAVPQYARGIQPRVLHLGLGAFHRAHQAMVFDRLLAQGDARWGVLGVAMRHTDLADALSAQDGLYALQTASHEGVRWQVGGAVLQTAVAAREPDRVTAALAAPELRWVTLSVTEKGYGPALAQLLTQGLNLRRQAGLTGVTLASCDNLSDNGLQLQALCLQAARTLDAALPDWLNAHCAFPCSMVDRIVPASTSERQAEAQAVLGLRDAAALGTEAFWEWVIERRFADPADEAALQSAGVTVVDRVRPFEDAKLGLLNGSHSAMACAGAVAGLPTVADCIGQPALRAWVHGLMTHEIAPHLQRPDWPAYRDALLMRFANPALKHSVHQIASDSSLKIPLRWVPAAQAQLRAGQPIERLAFAAAAWMRYCQGQDEQGRIYALSDPLGGRLQGLAKQHAGSPAATAAALGGLPSVWGQTLPEHTEWLTAVTRQLSHIQSLGVLAAAAALPG